MSSVILRRMTLQTIQVEVFSSVDGQGAPSFGTSTDIDVRWIRKNKVVINADGSQLGTDLTIWAPADTTPLPSERDRITADGDTFIVVQAKDVKDRKAVLAHRRLLCRRK